MVAKYYHSADIILDQAGEGLVIGGGNAGLQPVTVGGADVRERNASTSPKSRAAMATAKESMSLRGMEPPPFAAILVVVWPYCGGIVITGRKFKK